jgi:hypothetical protein
MRHGRPRPHVTPAGLLVGREPRRQDTFGGIVPTAATARGGGTVVAAMAVEHHTEGAAVPLLVLSDAPGVLGWDPVAALEASDDRGRGYRVVPLARPGAVGVLQATLWLEPEIPPDARTLRLSVRDLVRTSVGRGGGGVQRPLSGGPWELVIDLVPPRTAAEPPPEPAAPAPAPGEASGGVPSRALGAFLGLVPVGQARFPDGAAVSVWAIERYAERSVLTVSTLVAGDAEVPPLTPGNGRVDVWDDRGRRYLTAPIHGTGGAGWSESSVEVVPAVDPGAALLAIRLADVPRGAAGDVPGEMVFGVSLAR